ncbi:MAG: ATP synthase F1 subunit delta [Lachnospiraceae bacterium]|nr:ATP synthase F1 subunit delta [Lachnospiraceae bacterium]
MAKLISKTYGEALFQIALEKEEAKAGAADEMLAEWKQLAEILKANPEFDELMKHPGIPKTEKLDVVQKIFDGRISPENSEFIKLIVKKDRYRELPAIFEYFSDKMKEYKKIGVAYVSTAVKLTAAQEQQIQKRILETAPYESVEMHYAVEPELIGGMVIRIGDRVVDSSIKSKLNDLTKQLLQIQLG